MSLSIPAAVAALLDRLEAHGHRADVVGGCVRDMLLGRVPNDFDITTDATPTETVAIFADMRTVETGLKHGTLTVLSAGEPYEITTYRVDGTYADHRHPDAVSFTERLSDDLARRDFTVNAMCYHPARGVTDLFGGQEDLRAGVIRCVGDAEVRFEEDALRILRALRFSATLDFSIEEATAAAIRKKRQLLCTVSAERTYAELRKLLMGVRATAVFTEYREIFDEILPMLHDLPINIDIFRHLPTFPLRFCALFATAPDPVPRFLSACDALRADGELRRTGERLLPYIGIPTGGRRDLLELLSVLGEEDTARLLALRYALGTDPLDARERLEALLLTKPVFTVRALAIGGREVMACGYRSAAFGEMLSRALCAVMDGRVENTPEALCAYIGRADAAQKGDRDGI